MIKFPRSQPIKPAQSSAQLQLRKQNQTHPTTQPKPAAFSPTPIAPPIYRPQPQPKVLQKKSAPTQPSAHTPVRKPVPPVAQSRLAGVPAKTHCIQMVGNPLTRSQADPAREDQATNLKVSMDGKYIGTFKSGQWKPNESKWKVAFEGLGYGYSGKKPHAEEKFIGWLKSAGLAPKFISLSMDRSPCDKCANKLLQLKSVTIRVKATRINTNEQFEGLKLLKGGGIHFQYLAGTRMHQKYSDLNAAWESRKQSETESRDRYEKTINNYSQSIKGNVELAQKIYGEDVTLSWKQQKKSSKIFIH